MSETTEQPEAQPAPEPEPTPTPSPAPDTEAPEPQHEPEEKEDRRIAQLRARLGAAEREREAQRAELEHYRRQAQQMAPQQETLEQAIARIEREADARAEEKLLARRFHQEAYARYPQWETMRDDLVKMGADPGIATLLIEMPDGVRVAASLWDDPSELRRIAAIPTERGRAIALGKYAAATEAERPARATPQVTRAPAPIRPVTGRAAPQFNEYTADGNTLVDRYMRQDLEKRLRR